MAQGRIKTEEERKIGRETSTTIGLGIHIIPRTEPSHRHGLQPRGRKQDQSPHHLPNQNTPVVLPMTHSTHMGPSVEKSPSPTSPHPPGQNPT